MPVSDKKKEEVRNEAVTSSREYQHTLAAGIALYKDGNHGEIYYGQSGSSVKPKCNVVKDHQITISRLELIYTREKIRRERKTQD